MDQLINYCKTPYGCHFTDPEGANKYASAPLTEDDIAKQAECELAVVALQHAADSGVDITIHDRKNGNQTWRCPIRTAVLLGIERPVEESSNA